MTLETFIAGQGIAIGAFSIIVMVLITWQVYTLIDIRRLRKEAKKQRNLINKEALRQTMLSNAEMSDYYYSVVNLGKQPKHQTVGKCIQSRLVSIAAASELGDFDFCANSVQFLIELVPCSYPVSRECRKTIIRALGQIRHHERIARFGELSERLFHLNELVGV